jgi:hypothetical protein
MAKYIITASEISSGKTRYFEGYNDYGIVGEPRWGFDLNLAEKISALEVETERTLLIMLCPNLRIGKHRLNEYLKPKST